mmetsp:Transcript_35657/g.36148  ORF Transcript_35657/g.36148 Transcript_35657/m.36148 type:complete len:281 (+) Transcript_35657:165-1007(+)
MRRVLLPVYLASCLALSPSASVDAFASLTRYSPFAPQQRSKISPAIIIKAQSDDIPSVDTVIPNSNIPLDAQIYTPEQFGSSTLPQTTTSPPPTDTITTTATTTSSPVSSLTITPLNAGVTRIDPDGPMPPPSAPIIDLDTIALVVGQENYGLAIVLLGEAVWSFSKSPSVDHGLKTLLPAIVAGAVLSIVSGPMITSGDAGSVQTGLSIATAVSVAMIAVYAARLSAPFSPSPKEITAGGLLFAVAGFLSFSQNLVVDGFVTLPTLPSLPSLPTINLPF